MWSEKNSHRSIYVVWSILPVSPGRRPHPCSATFLPFRNSLIITGQTVDVFPSGLWVRKCLLTLSDLMALTQWFVRHRLVISPSYHGREPVFTGPYGRLLTAPQWRFSVYSKGSSFTLVSTQPLSLRQFPWVLITIRAKQQCTLWWGRIKHFQDRAPNRPCAYKFYTHERPLKASSHPPPSTEEDTTG